MRKNVVMRRLGIAAFIVVGLGFLVAANWESISRSFREGVDAQSKKAEATLFRLGELASITAELKTTYGSEPDLAYDIDAGARLLSIVFADYVLPDGLAAKDHALEIAAFAISKTNKSEKIDVIEVHFQTVSPGDTFRWTLDELKDARDSG